MSDRSRVSVASIYEPIKDGLELVEKRLKSLASVEFPWVSVPLSYVLDSGGKRVRPVLTLLSGKFHNYDLDKLVTMGTGIEVFHTASLVHDDAVDKALTRRGKPAVNQVWGEGIAVLLGDYLYALSADLICSIGDLRVMELFAKTLTELSSGQLRETFGTRNWKQTRQGYYEQINSKTASLFAASTGGGAILSGASEKAIDALKSYGRNVGLAFQVVDDILDFTADAKVLGKPAGNDLLQGTITLPTLLFMEQHPKDKSVKTLFEKKGGQEEVNRIIEKVRNTTTLEDCYKVAEDFSARARRDIEGLPDKDCHRSMNELADYVVERRK